MYKDFKDLHEAYGVYKTNKCREDMTEQEERNFVCDCFDTYEHIGFAETFNTPYKDRQNYKGMKFSVLGRVREITEDVSEGAFLDSLPMWYIQFENGDIMGAFPEEICLAERK